MALTEMSLILGGRATRREFEKSLGANYVAVKVGVEATESEKHQTHSPRRSKHRENRYKKVQVMPLSGCVDETRVVGIGETRCHVEVRPHPIGVVRGQRSGIFSGRIDVLADKVVSGGSTEQTVGSH